MLIMIYFAGLAGNLASRYGDELGLWLAKRIGKRIKGKENISHFRICDIVIPTEVQRYEEIAKDGCCAVETGEVTHFRSGRTFRFGFNYGH